jgi:Na+-driven multidrug efflux pump
MRKTLTNDITVGKPAVMLIKFALPIMLGNLFQQLYNIADTIIVGNTIGAQAVAAVGSVGGITFLVVAISAGAAIGNSVLVSQLFGAKHLGDMKSAIYTSLITSCVAGFVLMALGLIFLDPILHALQTPRTYIRARAIIFRFISTAQCSCLYTTPRRHRSMRSVRRAYRSIFSSLRHC